MAVTPEAKVIGHVESTPIVFVIHPKTKAMMLAEIPTIIAYVSASRMNPRPSLNLDCFVATVASNRATAPANEQTGISKTQSMFAQRVARRAP
jgi:hypothetical protein